MRRSVVKSSAVFLDRDGTINRDLGYTHRNEELEFLPDAPEAIRKLNQAGYLVIVITNQAGVGRGLYTEADVERFHEHMNRELAQHGAHIDAFYYCPHHPEAAQGEYRVKCRCRKPEPGMIEQAVQDHNIDLAGSWLVGDSPKDVEAGRRVNLRTWLLTAEPGANHAPDLLTAVERILGS